MILKKFNQQHYCNKRMEEKVLFDLIRYDWPGNVRELMHVIKRFVVSCEGEVITEALMKEVLGKPMASKRIFCNGVFPLREAREELDQILVHTAVNRYGSTRKAAEALGVNQSTVVRIQNKKD
jgi:transcriptional regulator with PAS, ATPase and Fis domain